VGARAYDPCTARWLQRDPIDAASGDPNLYGYAGNDPVNMVDPNGFTWYYDQRIGAIHWDDPAAPPCDFVLKGYGFSGKKGVWRNNPERQHEKGKGPIPAGRYRIGNRRACKSDGTPGDNASTARRAIITDGGDLLGSERFKPSWAITRQLCNCATTTRALTRVFGTALSYHHRKRWYNDARCVIVGVVCLLDAVLTATYRILTASIFIKINGTR
jgi:uncharacterized protein RhaS with RHS repeats